jgi:prepilin-type N-terminal cleavage/methylation domain-containing protein
MSHLMNRLRREDRGVSLVELLITIILMGTVSMFVTGAVIDANKAVQVSNNETQGLSDVRIAIERLARDIRDARAVTCDGAAADPTCANHLQLWIDYDSNYVENDSTGERITWQLRPRVSGQYDLVRTASNGADRVEARTIVQNVAFSYDYPPGTTAPAPGTAHTTLVNVNMYYNAIRAASTPSTRTVSLSVRLRNVS